MYVCLVGRYVQFNSLGTMYILCRTHQNCTVYVGYSLYVYVLYISQGLSEVYVLMSNVYCNWKCLLIWSMISGTYVLTYIEFLLIRHRFICQYILIHHNFPIPIKCTSTNVYPVNLPNSLIRHIFKNELQWINKYNIFTVLILSKLDRIRISTYMQRLADLQCRARCSL